MNINLPQEVTEILSLLQNEGHKAYCVGGAVRDSIMGLTPGDWDITTSALPHQTKEIFKEFGTKCIVSG